MIQRLMRTAVLVLVVLVLFGGCSTLTVKTDYNPEYDFTDLKTYAWLEGDKPSDDIRINNSLVINRVVTAVDKELKAKGYQLVDKDQADFYVNWFGGIENKIRQETINTYYGGMGYGYGGWGYGGYRPAHSRTYNVEYQEGILIIDIVDNKDKQLVWRGTGQDYVEEKGTPEKMTAGINQAVTQILSDFPPGDKPKKAQ